MTILPALSKITNNKLNVGLIVALVVLIIGAVIFVPRVLTKSAAEVPLEEIDLPFDAEGPYAILEPRRDGNAIVLNLKRVGQFEAFSYQMSYSDETGVDRGAGDLNTWIKLDKNKTEYSQEILLGSCSQGYSSGASHCVFDQGVENGTLVLRVKTPVEKGAEVQKAYKALITWHLQKPDEVLGVITSGDGHFVYTAKASRQDLTNIGFTLVNDLTGAPKLPEGKQFYGKVYAMNIPTAKTFPPGSVSIETVDKPSSDMKIVEYSTAKNAWEVLDTKVEGSKLTAQATTNGIFAILQDVVSSK